MYTIGDGNGIFKWNFFGDKEVPSDISKCYEELEVKVPKGQDPTFNHDDLLRMTQSQ